MSKVKLQSLLTTRLGLREPIFRLERIGMKWAGSIISESFKGKSPAQRQKMLRDALEAELGNLASFGVGTLLAYTPREWDADSPDLPRAKAG
jgi:acid stress-induced BolA-like protein IbaG/YrbA